VRLDGLKGIYEELRLKQAIESLQDANISSLPDVSFVRHSDLRTPTAHSMISWLYTAGKRLGFSGHPPDAMRALTLARDLGSTVPWLKDRLHLLRSLPTRTGIEWIMDLQEMQRQFGTICLREHCACVDHYAMARCLGTFGKDQPEELFAEGQAIAVLGLYHSWSLATVWSKLVKRIKRDHESHLIRFVARIAAAFMLHARLRWQDTDVLVPVPPSVEKFTNRGFAPTDMIAAEIGSMLGIPVCKALVRKPGVPTRQARYDEISVQFSLDERKLRVLNKSRIALIEDVVTTGRTVAICARKLAAAKPEAIDVLALARATRQ